MTFAEKFEYLKNHYADKADFTKIKDDMAAQITLTDEDAGGTFYVAVRGGKAEIRPYTYYDNTVSVRVHSALLEEILQGKKEAVNEFLLGNLDAEGEASHALALIGAMRVRRKKERPGHEL